MQRYAGALVQSPLDLLRDICHRQDLDGVERLVEVANPDRLASRGLVATNPGKPDIDADECCLQGLHFAEIATHVGVRLVHLVVGDRWIRCYDPDIEA
jgi:hypothetical protein